MVFNAGEAFTGRKDWLAWLGQAFGGAYAWASGAAEPTWRKRKGAPVYHGGFWRV